jgi:hypothetical protein
MITENPAKKLYSILVTVNKIPPNVPFLDAWATVFEIDTSNTAKILQKYGSLLELYSLTKSVIENHDRLNNDRNNSYINHIGAGLMSIHTTGSISNVINSLNGEVMTALYYLSENISLIYDVNAEIISDNQVTEIIKDVDELIANIFASELPVEVKKLLVKNLNIIRESLQDYFISGIDGVRAALEQSLGSLIMNNQLITPEVENENVKGVFKIMTRLNEFFSTVNGAKELIAPITKFFLGE